MVYVGISILCIVLALTKAIQDKIQFHFHESIFKNLGSWWNPSESWKNKWKNGNKNEGERFFLSSTLLVSLTDAWHFFGLIRNISIFIFASIFVNWYIILFYPLFFSIFHLLFTYIFSKKR